MLMLKDGNAFDKQHSPGEIYRCTNCGCEVVARAHDHLPPQDHNPHGDTGRPVRWRLLVQADERV
jgi:hypothetical protein